MLPSILGDFTCHHPFWDSKGTFNPRGKEAFDWVISSDFLLNEPNTQLFSVAILLTSLLLPLLAFGRCFRTWVLITSEFYQLFPFLSSSVPTNGPLPIFFRKLVWTTLIFIVLQRNTFFFLLLLLSLLFLPLNAAKFSIHFGRIKRQSEAWWFFGVDKAVSESRKAFAAAHRSDENRHAYISASDMPRLSKPRLRDGMLISRPQTCVFFLGSVVVCLPPPLSSPTLLQDSRLRSLLTT